MDLFGISRSATSNIAGTYARDGLEEVLKIKRSVNPSNTRRKADGRLEARIVEIVCDPAPEGHSRWAICLLEGQTEIKSDKPVSRETIRRALKKTGSDLTAVNTGASQTRRMQNL